MTGLKQGDLVRLKSSNLPMTIQGMHPQFKGFVFCTWLDPEGKKQENSFSADALTKMSENELQKHFSREHRRKDAQAGATWFDKASKLAAIVGASGAIVLSIVTYLQQDKIKELQEQIEKLPEKIQATKK